MARASSPELPLELLDVWYNGCSQFWAVCHDANIFLTQNLHELHAGGKPHMAASEHVGQERPGLLLIELIYRC